MCFFIIIIIRTPLQVLLRSEFDFETFSSTLSKKNILFEYKTVLYSIYN